jgi:hypothetical protein
MGALDEFLESYEGEHGVITEDEMVAAARRARSRAIVVRTPPTKRVRPIKRTRGGGA